jgi:hypothetical protein
MLVAVIVLAHRALRPGDSLLSVERCGESQPALQVRLEEGHKNGHRFIDVLGDVVQLHVIGAFHQMEVLVGARGMTAMRQRPLARPLKSFTCIRRQLPW